MPDSSTVPGIKIIRLNSSNINEPDDPSYPYKLEADLRPPEFLLFAFTSLYGSTEELVVRGRDRAAIDTFLAEQELRTHPRLRKLTITGPKGVEEEVSG